MAPQMIQPVFVFTRVSQPALSCSPLGRERRPTPGAVGPLSFEQTLALAAGSLAGWRRPTLGTWWADAGLLRLALVVALLEIFATRSERPCESGEAVGAEQDQHDDQYHEQLLRPKPKHHCNSFAKVLQYHSTRSGASEGTTKSDRMHGSLIA